MCDVRFCLQEVRDPWLFLKLTPVPTGPFCSPQHFLKQHHQRTWLFSLSWMMTRSYHEPKFGRLGLPDSSYTHPSHRPSGLSISFEGKRMMFSTDFNPQENIKKDGSGGSNIKMLGIHSFTLSLDPPSLILYCLRKTGSGLHDFIYFLLSGFFSGSVENATGGVWG